MGPLHHKRYFRVNTNVISVKQTITLVKTFGERLKEARLEAKLTQAQLARRCGYSGQGAIGNLEKRKTTSARHVAAVAKALGVNALWLEKEEGPKHSGINTPSSRAQEPRTPYANTDPGPDIKGRVPLISWVQAGDWSGVVDNPALKSDGLTAAP